jgi:hypothetical protein
MYQRERLGCDGLVLHDDHRKRELREGDSPGTKRFQVRPTQRQNAKFLDSLPEQARK